jgi:hypothetical protein
MNKIENLIFILGIIFSFALCVFSTLLFWKFLSANEIGCRFQIVKEIEFNRKTQISVLEDIFSNKVGLAEIKKIKIPLFENPKIKIKKFLPGGDFDSLNAEHFDRYEMGDFNKDGKKEIAFWFRKSGSGLVAPFYLYQEDNGDFKLLLVLLDPVSETEFKDFNNDGVFEIEHAFSLDGTNAAGRNLTKWKEIWAWDGKEYKKVNNLYPEIYFDLINFYNEKLKNYRDEQAKTFYKPALECLLEKAKQNQKKIFADGRECFKEE